MATFNFKTKSNKSAVLTIQGATVTDGCVPAPSPIVTEIASDDDFFTPIRTQSGKISLKGGIEDLEGIIGDNPLSRPVTLTIDSVVVWKGYLQCSAFSQDWCVGPNSLELPIISPLVIAESINLNNTNLDYQSFSDFVSEMNVKLGNPYTSIIYPTRNADSISYTFLRSNYADWDDDTKTWEMASYKDVLEDICKLFGWQCQERADKLIFSALDVEVPGTTDTHYIDGADHKIDYISGKKSVEASGNVKKFDATIYDLDITEDCLYEEMENLQYSRGGIYYYTKNFADNNEITTYQYPNAVGNIKVKNTQLEANTYYGATLNEDFWVNEESSWNKRIIIGRNSNDSRIVACKIVPHIPFFCTSNNEHCYFVISGSVSACDDYGDKFESYTGSVRYSIKYAGKYYRAYTSHEGSTITGTWQNSEYINSLAVENGNVTNAKIFALQGGSNGAPISMPYEGSGQIEIKIYAPASSEDSQYLSIDSFKVGWVMFEKAGAYLKYKNNEANKKKHSIGNGFQEEYSISSDLTTVSSEKVQVGGGIVIGATRDIVPSSLIANGTRPEIDLANRLKEYYKQTRRKISITVSSVASMLDVQHLHTVDTMTGYACLAQSVNWYDEEIKATFFELP